MEVPISQMTLAFVTLTKQNNNNNNKNKPNQNWLNRGHAGHATLGDFWTHY